jgi:polysaccharide pyruvyl transferase WcaK-like protein
MRNEKKGNPIRIYIDHWEDYESIGDQAMLLNAMRRLEVYLGPCTFVTPHSPKKTGSFLLQNMVPVGPPTNELTSTARQVRSLYSKARKLFPSCFPASEVRSSKFLDLAQKIIALKLFLYSLGLHFVFKQSFQDFLEEIKKCDVFFTVGDCSLNDYWLEGLILKSWLINTVRPFIPICVLSSQGIGPLTASSSRRRLVDALKKLDILSFRDFSYSKALVESEGLSGIPYKIVCDEAFTFPSCDQNATWGFLKAAGLEEGQPFIAVNFRNTDFTQNTTHLLEKIAELLDRVITTTQKSIVFVCMSKGDDYGRDHAAGLSLKSTMKQTDKFHVLEPVEDIGLVKGIIGQAAYTIGISYHLHVFSLSQGHPTIALYSGEYYKTKSDGLIAFYGEPSRSVDISKIDVEEVLRYIVALEAQYTGACAHVREVNDQILAVNDWTIHKLKEKLIEMGRIPFDD